MSEFSQEQTAAVTSVAFVWLAVSVLLGFFLAQNFKALSFVSGSGAGMIIGFLLGIFSWLIFDKQTLSNPILFNPNVFFDVLLPPIILDAGYVIHRQNFFRNFHPIFSTSVIGTIIVMTIVSLGILLFQKVLPITQLPWTEVLKFGALISAIDPVVTLSVFQELRVPDMLFNIVFGEAVLNDAVSLVLYESVSSLESGEAFSFKILLEICKDMLIIALGSLAVSVAVTLGGAFLLRSRPLRELHRYPTKEIAMVLIFSLLSYYVSLALSLSGVVSVFFCGIMSAHYTVYNISTAARESLGHFIHTIAYVAEQFTFLYMGATIALSYFTGETSLASLDWRWIWISVFLVLLSRIPSTFLLLPFANYRKRIANKTEERIPWSYQIVIFFAGLRGAVAFALAMTSSGPYRDLIVAATMIDVLFTNIVLGGLTPVLIRLLGIPMGAEVHRKDSTDEPITLRQSHPELSPISFYLPASGNTESDPAVAQCCNNSSSFASGQSHLHAPPLTSPARADGGSKGDRASTTSHLRESGLMSNTSASNQGTSTGPTARGSSSRDNSTSPAEDLASPTWLSNSFHALQETATAVTGSVREFDMGLWWYKFDRKYMQKWFGGVTYHQHS